MFGTIYSHDFCITIFLHTQHNIFKVHFSGYVDENSQKITSNFNNRLLWRHWVGFSCCTPHIAASDMYIHAAHIVTCGLYVWRWRHWWRRPWWGVVWRQQRHGVVMQRCMCRRCWRREVTGCGPVIRLRHIRWRGRCVFQLSRMTQQYTWKYINVQRGSICKRHAPVLHMKPC